MSTSETLNTVVDCWIWKYVLSYDGLRRLEHYLTFTSQTIQEDVLHLDERNIITLGISKGSHTVFFPNLSWQTYRRIYCSIILHMDSQECQFQETCCRLVIPFSLSTQGGAVQAGEAQFHLAKHWYHVVPLSRMALISALSWGRLIPTVLTLSPVLHCDTGHRRNSPHPHF